MNALAATLRHSGPTMVATCVVIVIGFSVLLALVVHADAHVRRDDGVGLVLAMLCDVFVSPFLLLAFSRKGKGPSTCRHDAVDAVSGTFLPLAPGTRAAR